MSAEIMGKTVISPEVALDNAISKMTRAVKFQTAIIFGERANKLVNVQPGPDLTEFTGRVKGLLRHSIYHSIVTIREIGSEEDLLRARGMVDALISYENGGSMESIITPSEDFRSQLIKSDWFVLTPPITKA